MIPILRKAHNTKLFKLEFEQLALELIEQNDPDIKRILRRNTRDLLVKYNLFWDEPTTDYNARDRVFKVYFARNRWTFDMKKQLRSKAAQYE